jgi:ABC-type glycerol-3-phosphate transport system permease component
MTPIKSRTARFFVYAILALFALTTSVPFLWTFLQSLKTVRQAFSRTPLIIFKPTLESYAELWLKEVPDDMALLTIGFVVAVLAIILVAGLLKQARVPGIVVAAFVVAGFALLFWAIPRVIDTADFYDFFINSIIVTVATVIISISVSCLAGYGLARFSGLDGVIVLVAALAFRALPRMAFALPYFQLSQIFGVHDTYFVLILVLVAVNQPFAVWMLRSFFEDIPHEIEESAMVDGAGRVRAFVSVIIPLMWPGIVSTALFTLLGAYHEFLLVRVLMQEKWTLAVSITQFAGKEYAYSTVPFAAAVSATVPLLIVILFFQEQLVKGLTAGAVKG